ncbi:MAG: twin-arginine translocase TatA/TatE family subunit [Sphingomonadales bacterium]
MGLSIWQILIVVVLIVLLFGRGKISELMGDLAKGIKSFKKGLSEDEAAETKEPPQVAARDAAPEDRDSTLNGDKNEKSRSG